MRCLTLADSLRSHNAQCVFFMRNHEPGFIELVRQRGYQVYPLAKSNRPQQAESAYSHWLGTTQQDDAEQTIYILRSLSDKLDWLVIDHYALDKSWEIGLREYADHLLAIDDLANRQHDCDLLLDQNLYQHMQHRYDNYLSEQSIRLLGPRFALLRPEFREARTRLRKRDGSIQRVFVFFGGADLANMTGKTIEAINDSTFKSIQFDIVIGSANPEWETLERTAQKHANIQLHTQVERMSELMSLAVIAIGAAGTTSWERCCLGLPSILAVLADNQRDVADGLVHYGLGISLGDHTDITPKQIRDSLLHCMNNSNVVSEMSDRCLHYVDGLGADRVVEKMMEMSTTVSSSQSNKPSLKRG